MANAKNQKKELSKEELLKTQGGRKRSTKGRRK